MDDDMTTRWTDVAADLRRKIMDGEWAPKTRIPAQRALADEYGASLHTVSRAVGKLIAEGLLTSDPARPAEGTWVPERQALIGSSRDRLASIRRTGKATGAGETSHVVSSGLVPASERIARSLGIEPGAAVVARHRVNSIEGVPVQCSTSYLPGGYAELVPELLSTERLPGGGTMGAMQQVGKVVTHGTDQYGVPHRGATAEEAAELQIAEGAPVQAGRNWWRGADGEVIEYGESVTVPGRWQSLEWVMPGPDAG